jgi:hypothetical protein
MSNRVWVATLVAENGYGSTLEACQGQLDIVFGQRFASRAKTRADNPLMPFRGESRDG